MLLPHPSLVVAGITGICAQAGRMAAPAVTTGSAVVQGECMRPIKGGRCPGVGIVTRSAVHSKESLVIRGFSVAGIACGWSALVTVGVALLAGQVCMSACQGEIGFRMVKSNLVPGSSDMAGCAVLPESAVVVVVFLMAGVAVGGCALVDVINMA
jgi:hypothetical protein